MSTSIIPAFPIKNSRFWAIQATNSVHRKWENLQEDTSRLIFQWNEIKINGHQSFNEILIAVSQAHPTMGGGKVKNIANGIYRFNRIQEGDSVLAINGTSQVNRVGVVQADSIIENKRSTSLLIKWQTEIKSGMADKPIFNPNEEIQKVSNKMLSHLDLPVELEENQRILSETIQEWHFKDLPELNLHFVEHDPKEDKGGKITLFYGTNRNRSGSSDNNDFYDRELAELQYGVCEVQIPKGHIQGEIERPFNSWFIELKESSEKHFMIFNLNPLSQTDFLATINKGLNSALEKAAFIFIHGYNTSFSEAAWRTAQIAWDIPFHGVAGFFSWPSSANTTSYAADIEKADSSISALEEFIKVVINDSEVEKLHLIAHSMGNRILTTTLNNLYHDNGFKPYLSNINQIILGAPDIDKDVFNNNILPIFKAIGAGRTLYASDKDRALHFSAALRGGRTRIGDTRPAIYIAPGIDTIDASNVPSRGNQHSYIFDTKELLADLYYLLTKGLPPDQRRLRPVVSNGLKYWLFPR